MTDLSIRSRMTTLEKSTNELESLKKIVRELFEKFLSESDLEIRRVGVKVSHLAKEESKQRRLTSFLEKS